MLPITLRYLCTLKSVRLMGRGLLVFLGLIYKPLIGARNGRAGVINGLREGYAEWIGHLDRVRIYLFGRRNP